MRRVWQHREGIVRGFTHRHNVKTLVWLEEHDTMMNAIAREKAVKKWRRGWKLELVESANPEWRDLREDILAR